MSERSEEITELIKTYNFLSKLNPDNDLLVYAQIIPKKNEKSTNSINFKHETFLNDLNVDNEDPLRKSIEGARGLYIDLMHEQLYLFSSGPLKEKIIQKYTHLEKLNTEHPLLFLAEVKDGEVRLDEKQFQIYGEISYDEIFSPRLVFLRSKYLDELLDAIIKLER